MVAIQPRFLVLLGLCAIASASVVPSHEVHTNGAPAVHVARQVPAAPKAPALPVNPTKMVKRFGLPPAPQHITIKTDKRAMPKLPVKIPGSVSEKTPVHKANKHSEKRDDTNLKPVIAKLPKSHKRSTEALSELNSIMDPTDTIDRSMGGSGVERSTGVNQDKDTSIKEPSTAAKIYNTKSDVAQTNEHKNADGSSSSDNDVNGPGGGTSSEQIEHSNDTQDAEGDKMQSTDLLGNMIVENNEAHGKRATHKTEHKAAHKSSGKTGDLARIEEKVAPRSAHKAHKHADNKNDLARIDESMTARSAHEAAHKAHKSSHAHDDQARIDETVVPRKVHHVEASHKSSSATNRLAHVEESATRARRESHEHSHSHSHSHEHNHSGSSQSNDNERHGEHHSEHYGVHHGQ